MTRETGLSDSWHSYKAHWTRKKYEYARYSNVTKKLEKGDGLSTFWGFGKKQAGAQVTVDPYDKTKAYIIGGMDTERRVTSFVMQVCISEDASKDLAAGLVRAL